MKHPLCLCVSKELVSEMKSSMTEKSMASNQNIGVGRFRILGGPRFKILGRPTGANYQQAHDVVMTSMRRNDVASTSFRRHVPNRFLINQCQIIAFLILKASTKFRNERNRFASTFKSN